jgi:transcriptional regulator with XRE-family HTH domain
MEIKMDIELWRKIKKEKKLTYDDIAKMAKLPITTVKYIFLGYSTTPRIDTVQAIEKALGIEDTWTEEEAQNGTSYKIKKSITTDELDMLNLYERLKTEYGEDFAETTKAWLWSLIEKKKII